MQIEKGKDAAFVNELKERAIAMLKGNFGFVLRRTPGDVVLIIDEGREVKFTFGTPLEGARLMTSLPTDAVLAEMRQDPAKLGGKDGLFWVAAKFADGAHVYFVTGFFAKDETSSEAPN